MSEVVVREQEDRRTSEGVVVVGYLWWRGLVQIHTFLSDRVCVHFYQPRLRKP